MSTRSRTGLYDTAWVQFLRQDQGQQGCAVESLVRHLEDRLPALNLGSELVSIAIELTALCCDLDEADRQVTLLLILTVIADVERGSTRTYLGTDPAIEGIGVRFGELLEGWRPKGDVDSSEWARRAIELLDADGLSHLVSHGEQQGRPIVREGHWLYQQRMFRAEDELARRLARRVVAGSTAINETPSAALTDVLNNPAGFHLSDEQARAVELALEQSITLVSGGPGTGKTSIVVALLRAFVRSGVHPDEIALAAPTGKAAWRMGASIRNGLAQLASVDEMDRLLIEQCPQPKTLHRLLEYSPQQGRYRRHRHDPVRARVVIIDEGSMIDSILMERLVSALRFETQLVILGDADQLPSVSAGAVFRDFLSACPEACTGLRHSYRMRADDPNGSAILRLAGQVNSGASEDEIAARLTIRDGVGALNGQAAEFIGHGGGTPTAFLDHWYDNYVSWGDLESDALGVWPLDNGEIKEADVARIEACFAHLEAARILSLTRAWDTGVERTNAYLHRKILRRRGLGDIDFTCGEPVMMLTNDYTRGLFNGDQGLIVRVAEDAEERTAVAFPTLDGVRIYDLDPLRSQLELAYCMTVHKSQGSEFERIAILLPTEELPLLSRELLYTGVTRCRSGVVMVGRLDKLQYAVDHPTHRSSGLTDRLAVHRTHFGSQ